MLTALEAANTGQIQRYIDEQLALRVVAELGYKWPAERIERIADAMPGLFAGSGNMPWSVSEAIHGELMMYGDGSILDPVGFISPHTAP